MNTSVLTPAQIRVFDRLVQGDSNLEIARATGIAEKTVKTHVTAIFRKFGCESRARVIARHYQGAA